MAKGRSSGNDHAHWQGPPLAVTNAGNNYADWTTGSDQDWQLARVAMGTTLGEVHRL